MIFCTESDLYKDNKNNLGGRNIFDLINFDIADAILISDLNLLDNQLKEKLINGAKVRNIPALMLEGDCEDCYCLKFNQAEGFEAIVRHVVEHHKTKKIHFMGGRIDSPQSNERLEALQKVLKEKKIHFDNTMISYGDFWEQPTISATQKIINSGSLPRAIICANDKMAITVISVLHHNGIRCPEDVIVTGFDGINEILFTNPKITSALCDYKKLGEETANYLLEIISNKNAPKHRNVPATFFKAESCGCKLKFSENTIDYISSITEAYNRYRAEDVSLNNMSVLIHDAKSIEEIENALTNNLLYNVMCCLKPECLNPNLNPNQSYTESVYGEEMFLLFDSDNPNYKQFRNFKTKSMLPNIDYILSHYMMPLIFTPINDISLPLGYLCFFFCNYDKQNYTKVGQIASWMSNAISGYRNMQYQRHLQKKIEEIYSHDNLTGLLNRNGFLNIYEKLLQNDEIQNITLAMCDLDNLKFINDTYSHSEGDSAIHVVAKALESAIEEGFFCRYGGDELIALYPTEVNSEELENKISEYLCDYNKTSNKPYSVTTSIGIYSAKKCSFDEMFKKADDLMYENKKTKKNFRC